METNKMNFLLWIHNPLRYWHHMNKSIIYPFKLSGKCFELYNDQSVTAKSLLLSALYYKYYESIMSNEIYDWTLVTDDINDFIKELCESINCNILKFTKNVISDGAIYLKHIIKQNKRVPFRECDEDTMTYLQNIHIDTYIVSEMCSACKSEISSEYFSKINCGHYNCFKCSSNHNNIICGICNAPITIRTFLQAYDEKCVRSD